MESIITIENLHRSFGSVKAVQALKKHVRKIGAAGNPSVKNHRFLPAACLSARSRL